MVLEVYPLSLSKPVPRCMPWKGRIITIVLHTLCIFAVVNSYVYWVPLAISGAGLRLSKSILLHGLPCWGWVGKVGCIDFILNLSLYVSFKDCCICSGSSGQRIRRAPRFIFPLGAVMSSTVPYCNVSGKHDDIHNNANSSISGSLLRPFKTDVLSTVVFCRYCS